MPTLSKKDIPMFVLRYRWPMMISLSIAVLIFEYFEHIDFGKDLFGGGFIWESLVFGVLIPVTGGLVMSLVYNKTKINSILDRIDRQRTLKNALLSVRDWDELVTIISQIPHTIFPNLFGDALYAYDSELSQFIRVSSWMSVEETYPDLTTSLLNFASASILDNADSAAAGELYQSHEISTPDRRLSAYSLPIIYQNDPIAILQLLFVNEQTPDGESLLSLSDLTLDIALAIKNYQNQSDNILQSTAARAERQRIARQLHDTLAQDLAFVRLKLEQLMNHEPLSEEYEFRDELFRLYKIADHSYEQVRNSLRSIRGEPNLEFTTALNESATAIADNLNFRVELHQDGVPTNLSIEKQLKILYIMREVLRNIGKHAQANLTTINVHWDEDCVQIDTIDNGKGFDVNSVFQEKQSHGLCIIEEVVAELDGRFDLQSKENDGTKFHFWFPISS